MSAEGAKIEGQHQEREKAFQTLPLLMELQGNRYQKRPSQDCKAQMWFLNQEDLLSVGGLMYLFQVLITAPFLFG